MEGFLVIALVFNIIFSFLIAEMGKQRQIGFRSLFWISVFLSPIVGLIVALSSPKISSASPQSVGGDRYKVSLDEAKKAAFKGEIEKAISLYQDTLYYLDNDYKNMNKNAEQSRQSLMSDIRQKIEELKQKI
jgi:MFS family permease